MAHPRAEVRATLDAYLALRARIEEGEATWLDLTDLFTDDATYIDPAWGRIQGIDEIRHFLVESMRGLEDWRFPIRSAAFDGDDIVTTWTQILPGRRADGRHFEQTGVSLLRYAGGGKVSFEEDLLNMAHVLEDLAESGWRPGPGFCAPPPQPDRDISRPY